MDHTLHLDKRMNIRGISTDMIYFTLNHGEVRGDRYITNKRIVRNLVDGMNTQITKLCRLRKRFKKFNVVKLIDKALRKLKREKQIALKIISKGGVTVITVGNSLITTYNTESYKKY